MKKPTAAGLLLCVLGPATLGAPASARTFEDRKTFSPSVCKAVVPGTSSDLTYSQLGLLNNSNSNRIVICPLVKDVEWFWNAGKTWLYAEYKAPSDSGGTVNCTAYVGSAGTSMSSVSSSTQPVTAGSTGGITLSPETSGLWTDEPVNLVCTLGAGMRLTRIALVEQSGETNVSY